MYLYEGNIDNNGKCIIKIPEIKNPPNLVGNVILEVIAENTFFEAWNDDFVIKQYKNVNVTKINEEEDNDETENVKINVNVGNQKINNQINEIDLTNENAVLPKNLSKYESDYVDYVKNLMENKILLKEYIKFEPKILTLSLGEMYNIFNKTKKDKSILFFLEKKVL